MTTDRTLPHNLAAEKSLLGAILVNNATYEKAAESLTADDFFRRAHGLIWTAMVTLIDRRQDIDPLTLTDELRRMGELDEVGGPAYLAALTDGMPRSANVGSYATIVKEHAVLRRIIRAGNAMMTAAYDAETPSRDIITTADKAILDLQRGAEPGRLLDLRETYSALYADLEHRDQTKGQLSGIDTGFPSINDITMGWQRGDMVVIAARPSIGKTAFTINTALAAAKSGKTVAIFSLEMRRRQLEYRMLATSSGVPLTRIQSGYLGEADFERLNQGFAVLHEAAIYIDDRGGQTVLEIRGACRRLKAEHGLDLVIVDYVQLIPGTLERRGANRNEELTDISRRLKALADEVACPVLVLSQLKRGSEERADSRPKLTDLRESGALEQDADLVCFLHRKHHRESGVTNFIIEKQRNGPAGTLNVTFNRDTQTFTDGGEDAPAEAPAEKPKRAVPPVWARRRG